MATVSNGLNAVSVIEDGLRVRLQDAVEKKLVARYLEEIKPQIVAEVRKVTTTLVLDNVERVTDHLQMRDEIAVYINMDKQEDVRYVQSKA